MRDIQEDVKFPNGADRVKLYIGTQYGLIGGWFKQGEVKRFNLGDKEYVVEIITISERDPPKVVISYNGERLKSLEERETERTGTKDFIYIGDILLNEAGETVSKDVLKLEIE